MPKSIIAGTPVITYDHTSRDKYWTALSQYLIGKYGKGPFTESQKVESILLDAFRFLVDQFSQLTSSQTKFSFFLYVFWLHGESIKLHQEILAGLKLNGTDEDELSRYRRILKLILEQGCDIDFPSSSFPSPPEAIAIESTIQELLYLGTWMYSFADFVAFQKMVEECHAIRFDTHDLLVVGWQHHYGEAYNILFPQLRQDYEQGTFDERAVDDLKPAIYNSFGIDYDLAAAIIAEIKRHHNPKDPTLQTIEPYVLPINLAAIAQISQATAEAFYNGLTLSRGNKQPIEEVICNPYNMTRYLYRPILVYRIKGKDRALIGLEKYSESIVALSTNAIQWNTIPEEWKQIKGMRQFMNKKGQEHDKILEDEIEAILKSRKMLYCRNIKSFKQPKGNNIRIDNETAGEIDYIIVDADRKRVIVSDVKYNRVRFEAVGFRYDYSNFLQDYEQQLQRKIVWVANNLTILEGHLNTINQRSDVKLQGFTMEGVFFINTPTFYMFNGAYRAITLAQTAAYIDGQYQSIEFMFSKTNAGLSYHIPAAHPYFKKPKVYAIINEAIGKYREYPYPPESQ